MKLEPHAGIRIARADLGGRLLVAILFATFFAILPARESAAAGSEPDAAAPLSPRNANYDIDARLDTRKQLITGTMTLRWRNITSHPTSELRFHLYENAWLNNESSKMHSWTARADRREMHTAKDWSYIKVNSLQLTSPGGGVPADLLAHAEFIQPDDGNPFDRTVLRVPLPSAVEPGGSITVKVAFETQVASPKMMVTFGALDDYYFLGRWFPQIGVLQEDGAWNCHQYVAAEYFSDFGVYDVKLNLPTGWVVGATGEEIESRDNGDGSTLHHFHQADVHAFAWVTSPHFTVHEKLFSQPGLPPVKMRLLLNEDNAGRSARFFAATEATLKEYGQDFGPYPYGHLTIVNTPSRSETNGVEYPTLFTTGGTWLAGDRTLSIEMPLLHEAGHQFWYGIVANNETEDAWLDEGINSYSAALTERRAYPPPLYTKYYFDDYLPVTFQGIEREHRYASAAGMNAPYSQMQLDPLSAVSFKEQESAYWANGYLKPPPMLLTLERYLGWDTFQKVMSTYFTRWKFKHPKPRDFLDVVNEVSGQDLDWFWDQIYYDDALFDYGVGAVESNAVPPIQGYAEPGGAGFFDQAEGAKNAAPQFRTVVGVHRWGNGVFPVDVQVDFEGGESVTEHWDGKARYREYVYVKPSRVAKVIVDPRHVLALDVNPVNNSWLQTPRSDEAARKWTSKWMFWMQNLLESFAFFV
jgi:hypothetical protein